MSGKTRYDRITIDSIRESWVSTYRRKDGRNKVEWFGYVERRPGDFVVRRRVDQMQSSQLATDRGRPRKNLRETNKEELRINKLDDRTLWWRLIHIADPLLLLTCQCCVLCLCQCFIVDCLC
jgi:hypothetical protein